MPVAFPDNAVYQPGRVERQNGIKVGIHAIANKNAEKAKKRFLS